jgi:hypothetical protein
MLVRRRFDLQLAELMPDLGIMRSAALELRGSERFREILQVKLSEPSRNWPLIRRRLCWRLEMR